VRTATSRLVGSFPFSFSLSLSLSLVPKRKLGVPRRNLKKVVRLPALSLRPSLNPCTRSTSERERRDARRGASPRVAAARLGVFRRSTLRVDWRARRKSRGVYRSRSRTRPEREKERERESLERTCCARTSTSLQCEPLHAELRPSNTFRRNCDFSQLWTRAGARGSDAAYMNMYIFMCVSAIRDAKRRIQEGACTARNFVSIDCSSIEHVDIHAHVRIVRVIVRYFETRRVVRIQKQESEMLQTLSGTKQEE